MRRSCLFLCLLLLCWSRVDTFGALRRPISSSQPAWIVHIDVWNYADPQKIIDMVPEDVRPFVIFNIATSSSDDKSADGPAIYDSWMKVCAQNRVWTMIQCASGAYSRMPDTPSDVSAYEKYYQEYPNFIGFNFAEQYWGFDTEGNVAFDDRLNLFAQLLSLAKNYGGYLAVSFADSYYNANKMPVAYMKRNADINAFLSHSPEHFLCFEKFTQKKNFLYNESYCLGAWLSDFAGSYGIRFDSSGWIGEGTMPDMQDGDTQYTIGNADFVRAAGAIPIAERFMLTGQTIMDGPELIWTECSKEASTSTADGYTQRNWEWTAQWNAIPLGLFRKILDGTIRIPSKEEVMARTKVCVVSEGDGTDNASYRIPAALYDGLYRNDKDAGGLQGREANHWLNNRWWMKSTGRYPTIPNMLSANGLTDIGSSVGNTAGKLENLNSLFPAEYSGDIFAGRHENGWVTYNPYQYDDVTDGNGVRTLGIATQRATGVIPFQYNTCASVDLDYAPYSLGIMKEYNNKVTFYLQNYEGGTDVIKINGAGSQPSYTANTDNISETWADGVYTLTVTHSGTGVELTINCEGSATDRQTSYTTASIVTPDAPSAYTGMLQYEAELADYQNVTVRKSGYGQGRDGYQGQGFAEMPASGSSLRFHVNTPLGGFYLLTLRYQAEAAGNIRLTSGDDTYTTALQNGTAWTTAQVTVGLKAGQQAIDIDNTTGGTVYADCIRLESLSVTAIDETGGTPAVVPSAVTTADITYTRMLTAPASGSGDISLDGQAANLYTVCLPYTPPATTGLKYYTLTGASGDALVFVEAATAEANTPYLVAVTGSESVGDGSRTSVNFSTQVSDGTPHNGYRLRGTLRGLSNAEVAGKYILQPNNIWGLVPSGNPGIYLPPFRAYIEAENAGSTRCFSALSDGTTTGIRHLQTQDTDGTIRWYDLNGRPISQPSRKGVYIRNGRKVMVR